METLLKRVQDDELRPKVEAGSFLAPLVAACSEADAEARPAFVAIVEQLSDLVAEVWRGTGVRANSGAASASAVRRPSVLPSPAAGAIPHAAPAAGPSERLSKPELSKHASTVGHWFGWHDDSERTKDRPGRWSRRDRASGEQSADGGVAGLVTPAANEDDSEGSSMPEARRMTRAAREAAAAARGEGAASSRAPAPSAAELAALDLEA